MAKAAKQICIVDVSGERISKPDFGIPQETPVGGSGNHPLEGENNPYCRFVCKLSSEATSSWWSIFKEKCDLAFPKKAVPSNFFIQETESEESKAAKNKSPKPVFDWEWRISSDEKQANKVFADCSLNDLEVVLDKLSVVINDTQAKANALEKLIQDRIAKVRAQKKLK